MAAKNTKNTETKTAAAKTAPKDKAAKKEKAPVTPAEEIKQEAPAAPAADDTPAVSPGEEVTNSAEEGQLDLKSREALNQAAVDMNEVMGLEPGIDTTLDDTMFMKAFTKAAEMATGTDNFADFTWQVLAANNLGPERVLPKPLKKSDAAAKTAPKDKAAKKEKAPKAPGVIATIRQFCTDKAASDNNEFALTDLLNLLVKTFPDRNEDSLMATVRTQVPGRVKKELGLTFEKIEGGKYKVSGTPTTTK